MEHAAVYTVTSYSLFYIPQPHTLDSVKAGSPVYLKDHHSISREVKTKMNKNSLFLLKKDVGTRWCWPLRCWKSSQSSSKGGTTNSMKNATERWITHTPEARRDISFLRRKIVIKEEESYYECTEVRNLSVLFAENASNLKRNAVGPGGRKKEEEENSGDEREKETWGQGKKWIICTVFHTALDSGESWGRIWPSEVPWPQWMWYYDLELENTDKELKESKS